MSLVHVSLFSGIGGIDLAMHRACVPTVLACEFDKAAAGVLAYRFPGIPIHPDVRTLTGEHLRRLADPRRTVLSAGFPCQDLSVAGARRGMVQGSGTRSALFWEVDRLLAEFAPAWVVLENVPGLLSSRGGRDMGAVLGSLGQRGYGFAYRVLDARHFGVPQRRRRVVVVGHLGDDRRAPARVLLEPEGLLGDPAAGHTEGALAAARARGGTAAGRVTRLSPTLTTETGTGAGMDLDAAAADALVIGVMGIAYAADETSTLQAAGGDRGWRTDAESAAGGHLVATFQKVIRSGARDEEGNLPPEVWAHRDVAATLNLSDLGSESRDIVVRRLTPTECERLQGYPDGWTATSGGKTRADSPRYKQLGNSVAVPVFEWVARRIVTEDAHLAERSA